MLWIISIESLTNYGVSAGLLINQQWEEILQSRQYWLKRLISKGSIILFINIDFKVEVVTG